MRALLARHLLKLRLHKTLSKSGLQCPRRRRRFRRPTCAQCTNLPLAHKQHATATQLYEECENNEEAKVVNDNNAELPERQSENEKVDKRVESSSGPIIPAAWHDSVHSICGWQTGKTGPSPVIVICGGKNAGKSTFGRFLLNSLLKRYNRVGFLDTDVGQPELTPSGCVSLHVLGEPILGLSVLETRNPERCCFYGDISPKVDPDFYLQNIFSLYDYFVENYAKAPQDSTPLVINTHGWIQGIGFDVLVDIICHATPTHVVQILLKSGNKNLPHNKFWHVKANNLENAELIFLDSAVGSNEHLVEIKYNARELRDLRLMSYFTTISVQNCSRETRLHFLLTETAIALASAKPFQVPASAINVIHLDHWVPPSESMYCLNATIIGLGVSSNLTASSRISRKTTTYCIGLGIVRAVDVERKLFYVITPVPLERLQQVDTFFHGRLEIPIAFLMAPGYISPYLCCNTISIEGTGSAPMGSGKKKYLHSQKLLLT